MNTQKVDLYIVTNQGKFPAEKLPNVKEKLLSLEDDKFDLIQMIQLKDPTISLIISLFFGVLGIDRMLIGDIGLGVAKLLTAGGCGIWTIIDWFYIMEATREKNYAKFITNSAML